MWNHCRHAGYAGLCDGFISEICGVCECGESVTQKYCGVCVSYFCAEIISGVGVWVGKWFIGVFVFGYWGAGTVVTLEVWSKVEGDGKTAVVKDPRLGLLRSNEGAGYRAEKLT